MSFDRSNRARYLSEFVGTFLLVFGVKMIVGGGGDSPAVPLGVGILLSILIYQYGGVSGGHLNPAVTIGLIVRNPPGFQRRNVVVCVMYLLAQFVGGIMGGMFACAAGGEKACNVYTTVNTDEYTAAQAFFAEFMFTCMLVSMVMNIATDARLAGNNQFYGVAIGLVLTTAAIAIGPITGAAINPAVWVGTVVSASLSVEELQSMDVCYIYLLAQVLAGITAGVFFQLVYGGGETDYGKGFKESADNQGPYQSAEEMEEESISNPQNLQEAV